MENDPLEINKLPDVIKDAQNEISTLDVLVCGKCHDTFHFVEQFQEHHGSAGNCKGVSQLKDFKKCESKPQTWGFLLWKNMHVKKTESDASLSPWLLYQKWCKISEEHRNSWIAAGENLLFVNKITTGKVQELKASVKNKLSKVNALDSSVKANDTLEEGEIRPNRIIEKPKKVVDKRQVLKSTQPTANSISAIKNGSPKKALRTCKNDIIVMGTIDKILNRRYNSKTKSNEYLIKWADSEDTANTWEPRKNVEMCKILVEEYDQTFDKVKSINTKSNDSVASSTPMDVDEPPTSGRPQRTSKKKALNQVKAWCGDITEENEESEKRKFLSDDDDSSDSFEKKFKMEDDTESSDEEKPPITIRKVGRPPSNSYNGLAKKSNEITNMVPTQRVVRVSQKQMPNLATGVYLMSKTDGIVKLDSSAPSGSPSLKVGQKIGQTQIKMVQRKEVPTKTPIKATTKYVQKSDGKVLASTPKVGSNMTRKSISQVSVKSARIIENEKHDVFGSKIVEDEDSDGLEELAFPVDLPLPVPDSPPREFTLCPLTGKVLGQTDEPEETLPENASLDTLVQLAVMDSPPDLDDMKEGKVLTKNEVGPSAICTIPVTPKIEESKIHTITDIEMDIRHSEISKSSQVKAIVSSPTSIATPTKAPLLNKVLSAPKPLQPLAPKIEYPKKLLSTPTQIRPKVTNPTVTTTKPLINRPVPSTTIIHKVASSRHKTVLPKPSVHDPVLKRTTNVTTYKPANRRIPNTIPPPRPVVKPTISKVVASPPPQPVVQTPASIMSMPILTTDEEQPTTSNIVAPVAEIEQPMDETENDDMGELSTYNMLESETPILITGEDGTIYQVAGQNEEGQTILISEDADGHQQCVIVASDNLIMDTSGGATNEEVEAVESTFVEEAESEGGDTDNEPSQVVAQIVNADPPSPGGTRKVVLLLPDGNLVKTEVSAEQYASI